MVEALKAAGDINQGAAFFGEAGPWQDHVAGFGGTVAEDVVGDQELEILKVINLELRLGEQVFVAESEEALRPAASLRLNHARPHRFGTR